MKKYFYRELPNGSRNEIHIFHSPAGYGGQNTVIFHGRVDGNTCHGKTRESTGSQQEIAKALWQWRNLL